MLRGYQSSIASETAVISDSPCLRTIKNQARRRFASKMGENCFVQIFKQRSALLNASCDRRPNALAPISTRLAARALRHPPVDRHKTNRLLRQIVGRLHIGRGNELKVALKMRGKAITEVVRFPRARRFP